MQKGILSRAFPRYSRTNVFSTKFAVLQNLNKRYQKIFILGSFIYFIYRDYTNSSRLELQYISAGVKFNSFKPLQTDNVSENKISSSIYKSIDVLFSKKTVTEDEDNDSQERSTSKKGKNDDEPQDAKEDDKEEKEEKDKKKKDKNKSDDEDDSDDDDDNGGGGLLMPVISWLGRLSRGFAPSS